jgi:hypothetical protein
VAIQRVRDLEIDQDLVFERRSQRVERIGAAAMLGVVLAAALGVDSVLRGVAVYGLLLVIFRVTGKRSLGQITTFDFILLLIISEAIQNGLRAPATR